MTILDGNKLYILNILYSKLYSKTKLNNLLIQNIFFYLIQYIIALLTQLIHVIQNKKKSFLEINSLNIGNVIFPLPVHKLIVILYQIICIQLYK